jgi:anti-sigma-K factor RskA
MAAHPSRDDLVAFTLGALDPEERRVVEEHAQGCASCSRELEALAPAVGVLGESVEQLVPPPEMRERVLAIVNSEAEAREEPAREPRRRKRRDLRGFLLRPATGLATVAVLAAGIAGYLIADDGGGGAETTTVAVMPEAPRIGGTLEVGDVSSTLRLQGMRQLTGDDVYQVWVAEGTVLRPSSNFIPERDGTATTGVDGHLEPGTRVMVTREPRAGRTTPTPPILLSATVQ